MNKLKLCLICLTFLFACKKTEVENVAPAEEKAEMFYKDSLSFEIGDKTYVFDERDLFGAMNAPVNLKPYPSEISGRKVDTQWSGFYYYGSLDSVLYGALYGFHSRSSSGIMKLLVTKQYRKDQLNNEFSLLRPNNHSSLFTEGRKSFAVDLETGATTEGVAFEGYLTDIPGHIATYIDRSSIPSYSTLESVEKNLQDDSKFEITKCDNLDDGRYLVEAKFEVNFYDRERKLYRVKNGFMRLVTNMKPIWNRD